MPWWLLLVLLGAVWFLESIAAAAAKTVAARRRGITYGSGGVSVMPGLLVMPLLFLGIALAVDHFANPWGTRAVALLHGVFAIVLVTYIAWAFHYLRGPGTGTGP